MYSLKRMSPKTSYLLQTCRECPLRRNKSEQEKLRFIKASCTYTSMLLMGICTSLTIKPIDPRIINPIEIAHRVASVSVV